MTTETQIRRRPDGSIDTAHYMAKGRTCRSDAAHRVVATGSAKTRRPLFSLAALFAMIPFLGGHS